MVLLREQVQHIFGGFTGARVPPSGQFGAAGDNLLHGRSYKDVRCVMGQEVCVCAGGRSTSKTRDKGVRWFKPH